MIKDLTIFCTENNKKKGIKQFKRLKTPYTNDATRKRRVEGTGCLLEKFETNPRMIEFAVFQGESDFPLKIPVTVKMIGQKKVSFLINVWKLIVVKPVFILDFVCKIKKLY